MRDSPQRPGIVSPQITFFPVRCRVIFVHRKLYLLFHPADGMRPESVLHIANITNDDKATKNDICVTYPNRRKYRSLFPFSFSTADDTCFTSSEEGFRFCI